MSPANRARFDTLLEKVIAALPETVRDVLQDIPVIVEDLPSQKQLDSLAEETGERIPAFELCGMHSGIANTELGVEGLSLPSEIYLFRIGIVEEAGGWKEAEGETSDDVDAAVSDEIRITLLHELGHQFGLGEDDLEDLGYQ